MQRLRNRFVAIRHGESTANVEGIIISSEEFGVSGYGLTEKGKQQAVNAGAELLKLLEHPVTLNEDTPPTRHSVSDAVIVTSNFLRAKETAEIVASTIGARPVHIDARLRSHSASFLQFITFTFFGIHLFCFFFFFI
jgi:broad specificity phosphatase PhoE